MPMHKILIPVDGSDRALDAVRYALELCGRGLRARFVVANAQAPANLYELVVAHDPQVLQQVSEGAGRDLMRSAVELLRAAGQAVEQEVLTGDPTQVLLEVLERHGCDAVFLSAQGAGVSRNPLGTVALALVEASPVPVTVVRSSDTAPT